jgi:glycerophosphoryl diester phosphodiesterase
MTTHARNAFFAGICLILTCCNQPQPSTAESASSKSTAMKKDFDFQGHRGCRGLLPENSIEGFIKALDLGVTTLEMDVVITADNEVLLSHDPYFSHLICTGPNGLEITENNEKDHVIYRMTYAETKRYDCGSKKHPSFPEQVNIPLQKPLLLDVIQKSEQHARKTGRSLPYYNIETKSTPEGDGTLHPAPDEFASLLAKVIFETGIEERAIVQSFDIRTLQYLQRAYPTLKLALLIENLASPENNLEKLGFTPEIYSPYYKLVNKKLVEYCAKEQMKLLPWTVNEPSDMEDLIDLGVDGIISDYPDRFSTFIPNQN